MLNYNLIKLRCQTDTINIYENSCADTKNDTNKCKLRYKNILDAMMKILNNLRNNRDGTMMVPMSIHVALMPYVQD